MKLLKGQLILCNGCQISISKRPTYLRIYAGGIGLFNDEKHVQSLLDKDFCHVCAMRFLAHLEKKAEEYIKEFEYYITK